MAYSKIQEKRILKYEIDKKINLSNIVIFKF